MSSIDKTPPMVSANIPLQKNNVNGSSSENQIKSPDVASRSLGSATVLSLSASTSIIKYASGNKDFATVAKGARANLDIGYQKLKTSSDQLWMNGTQDDWNTAFGGLDRRSLYAIKSNEGGQFTAKEQDIAKSFMAKQQEHAMGLDTPTGRLGLDISQGFKDGVKFLDSVSDEEKGSFEWAEQRASAQYGDEAQTRLAGQEPENLESTNPIVKMIKAGIDALAKLDDPSKKLSDMPQYKQAQQIYARDPSDIVNKVDINI